MLENTDNSLRDNFFTYNDDTNNVVTTIFDMNKAEDSTFTRYPGFNPAYFVVKIGVSPSFAHSGAIFYRHYLASILSEFGGLATAVISFISFIMAGVH